MKKITSYKPCESLSDLISNDEFRYQQKGYHLLTSAVSMFCFFYIVPDVIQLVWRYIIPLGSWRNVYLILNIAFPLLCHLLNNTFYLILYHLKLPQIEKYRILQVNLNKQLINLCTFLQQIANLLRQILSNILSYKQLIINIDFFIENLCFPKKFTDYLFLIFGGKQVTSFEILKLIEDNFFINQVEFLGFYHFFIEIKQPWPWEKSKEEWIPFRNRLIKYIFMNLIIVNISLVVIEYIQGVDHYNYSIETLPSKTTYFLQVVFFMVMEDFFFYFSHRFFHWKPVYRFHKVHHEHYNAFCCTVTYTHPIDYFFGSVLPFVSGFKILGYNSHFSVYIFWQLWRILETYDGHCGYEFPWAMFRIFPFSGSSDYHNFHHSKNMGNFSSFFTYLDSIFKTNKEYLLFKQQQSNKQTKAK